jgi:hypothetical protein
MFTTTNKRAFMLKNKLTTVTASVMLFVFSFSYLTYGQNAMPQWINDNRRDADYPSSKWYVAFSQNTLKDKSNVEQSLKQLERDAQSKLSESIIVRISEISSLTQSSSERTQNDGGKQTQTSIDYRQNVLISTDVELTKTQIHSFYDRKKNKIYAFAAVRKSDLADFYAAKIEFALNEAKNNVEQAKQSLEVDKRKEAREKLNESRKLIDSTVVNYRTLLVSVDTQNGLKRSQSEKANELLKEIATVLADIEAGDVVSVFLEGEEKTVISGLQTILSENDIIITENKEEASLILKIEANLCNQTSDGSFHFVYACVKAILQNTKTGRNELTINITGQKQSGLSTQKAEEKAFKSVVPDVWVKVKDKVLENLQK